MDLSREQFDREHRPRRGTANAERMRVGFWDWMLRGAGPVDPAGEAEEEEEKSYPGGYSPYQAREVFASPGSAHAPIWTAERMGMTRTALPDGRVVWIGGEHEDHYDPDFYIYNDVIVVDPAGDRTIFGYPAATFPPTDFHSATLVGDRIVIIGGLGYPEGRRPGQTPVHALDLATWRVEPVAATGEVPGWLHGHSAEQDEQGRIVVRGGTVVDEEGGSTTFRDNIDDYRYDPTGRHWQRLTRRNWRQYLIVREDHHLFVLKDDPGRGNFYPTTIPHEVEASSDWNAARFRVRQVLVRVQRDVSQIKLVVEGDLPPAVADAVAEEVRARVAAAIGHPCSCRRVGQGS